MLRSETSKKYEVVTVLVLPVKWETVQKCHLVTAQELWETTKGQIKFNTFDL